MARRAGKSNKRKNFGAAGTLLALFLVLLVGLGAAAWVVLTPFGPQSETFVDIAPGSSTTRIGRQLEAAGVVRSGFGFALLRLWKRSTLRAGEYRFSYPAPMTEVYDRIARGDVYTKTVIVPEGANIFEIGRRLQEQGYGTESEFVKEQAREAGLIRDLDPDATSLEGYLFPDTYRFPRKASMTQIIGTMVRRFRHEAALLGLKENVHEVVTIASLVERETAVDAERPLVASVFENRLAKHMPLMTDPSVIYGLELAGEWRGEIYQSNLTRDTPYNTYMHAGLPPGPVSNPGLQSLRAAMHPAHTDYLYFVAAGLNPQGHSNFSSTLEEHQRHVAGYRRALKKAGDR